MRYALAMLVLLFGGCLGEPERPHGLGPPIAPGSVLRPRVAVADLNADGYDDLAFWGNEGAPGTNPTLFVFFGGEILQNPDLRADLSIYDAEEVANGRTPVWYEAMDGAPYVSARGDERGLVLLTGQDMTVKTTPPSADRRLYASYFPVKGRSLGERQISDHNGRANDTYAPDDSGFFILQRDTEASLPARQLIWGDQFSLVFASPLDPKSRSNDMVLELTDPPYLSNAYTMPGNGTSQDVLVMGEGKVVRTLGDPAARGSDSFLTFGARDTLELPHPHGFRRARARQEGDHFYAVMDNGFDATITVIDVAGDAAPIGNLFVATSRVADTSIGQLGGDSRIDVAVIQSGTLGVYLDIDPGTSSLPEIPTPAHFGSRDALPGYDLLAVGNFHGDERREIYAISASDPAQGILCYRVVGNTLERCAGE